MRCAKDPRARARRRAWRRAPASRCTIGRRCSLSASRPSFFIMYFIGIGFVSKNTALLISSSCSCKRLPVARSAANTASHISREHFRLQVADGVHQAAGPDRHHREAELLEPDEDFEVAAELVQAFGDETEVVDGLLDADEVRRALLDGLQGVERDADGRAARNVINHPRHVVSRSELQVIRDEAALRRADVVGRHDQQRIGAGGRTRAR